MTILTSIPVFHPTITPILQAPKRLRSGDEILIVTDATVSWSPYIPHAPEQQWIKAAAYDLHTGQIGFFEFGRDDLFAMIKAGLTPPPWQSHQTQVVLIRRQSTPSQNKGRHPAVVQLSTFNKDIRPILRQARTAFAASGFCPSFPGSLPSDWVDLVKRANRENAIEAAIKRTIGWFKSWARFVRETGHSASEVGYILSRFVAEHRLERDGVKKGTRYRLRPVALIQRADWNG